MRSSTEGSCGAEASGLSLQADSWVRTGGKRARLGAGGARVVNGLTPDDGLPADDDLDKLVAKFGG